MSLFGDIFGGGKEAEGAKEASRLQRKAYRDTAPYREAGKAAIERLQDVYITGEQPYTVSPGYDFRREEGLRGLDRFLAARGLGRSGRAVRGGARYLDELAAQEYEQGFNRLAALAGIGQTASGQGASALRGQATH